METETTGIKEVEISCLCVNIYVAVSKLTSFTFLSYFGESIAFLLF